MNESTIPPASAAGADGAEVTSGDGSAMNQVDGSPAGANSALQHVASPGDLAALIPAVTRRTGSDPCRGAGRDRFRTRGPCSGAGRCADYEIHPSTDCCRPEPS